MSPESQIRGGKVIAGNNIYTGIIGIALFSVLATLTFVAVKCYFQYGTIFSVP